mgnify:CR=1 FL=1
MVPPVFQPGHDGSVPTFQVDQLHVIFCPNQFVPVCLFKGGASNYTVPATLDQVVDEKPYPAQPRPTVIVGQGNTLGHLVHVGPSMKIVAFVETTTQGIGKESAYDGLPSPGYAHQNDNQ